MVASLRYLHDNIFMCTHFFSKLLFDTSVESDYFCIESLEHTFTNRLDVYCKAKLTSIAMHGSRQYSLIGTLIFS